MKKSLVAIILVSFMAHAQPAIAQAGALISIIGGIISSGSSQMDRDASARKAEEARQQIESDRIEQDTAQEAAYAEHVARIEAQRLEEERKAEERADAIRAKRIQPTTIEDLDTLYDPDNGWDIAASPKLKPDRARYLITGRISRHVSDDVLICETFPDKGEYIGHYFTVKIYKKTKKARDILDRMRIGGELYVVGKYIGNFNYPTVSGAWSVMPIFAADHIIVPGSD